jgi:signal transduction histidine kinase
MLGHPSRRSCSAPLQIDDVGRFIANALHCEPGHAQPLTELVHEKTGGNPFFAIQFFIALAEEGLLAFDAARPAWQWDIHRIRAKSYTDNVVDLMAGKLKRLSATTQEALLDHPTTVVRILDPHSPLPEALRFYLLGLGVKTLLIIPLTFGGQANGQLSFRFTAERDFHPEEIEIARALATQASLAIHLTRLAKTARQSAILEERNQLAAEIHDALAQSFTGISMQLGVAVEQLAAKQGDPLCQIQRANEIAKYGLAEARRSILSLRSGAIEESGLTTTLQRLVDHSNVAGRLRCDFRTDNIPEKRLPPRIQHELLRFAQEAISNAVRHAKPTVVSVTLRWKPPNLILKVKDDGSGISRANLKKSEGFGLSNMRTRASQIGGKLDIKTGAVHGTSIILTVPIPS